VIGERWVAYDGGMSEEERRRRYAIEKLYLTICDLVGTGEVRERLHNAYISHLVAVSPDDFPEPLRDQYQSIHEALTWQPPEHRGQGKLRPTINSMSEEEAVMLGQRLVSLFWDMVKLHPDVL
jgi:hypothetical protein